MVAKVEACRNMLLKKKLYLSVKPKIALVILIVSNVIKDTKQQKR